MKDIQKPLSFADLISPKPPRRNYVETNFIPVSSKVLMGGLAKVGKSFCCMELARALATGTPLFHSGRFPVVGPVKVLLCDKELGPYSLGERLQTYFAGANEEALRLASANIVAVSGNPEFKFDDYACRRSITQHLDEIRPNVMIVDPVSKFMSGSDQDNDDVRRFLEFMDVLVERFRDSTGLSIVMSHHFRKPNVDYKGNLVDPGSSYNFRGGSRWYDDMDSLVTVQRHDVDEASWLLECEAEFRHGQSPPTFWLDVRPARAGSPVREIVKPASKNPLKDRLLK